MMQVPTRGGLGEGRRGGRLRANSFHPTCRGSGDSMYAQETRRNTGSPDGDRACDQLTAREGQVGPLLRKVAGLPALRFHDLRHHAITVLAESQASDATIMAIAGHVSREMLEHYSHVRLDLKRKALEGLATGRSNSERKPASYDTKYDTTQPSVGTDCDVSYGKEWSALADDFRTLLVCDGLCEVVEIAL